MSKIKAFLTILDKNKGYCMKFLILCCSIKFCSSTVLRMYRTAESRTHIETAINIYSMIVLLIIFFTEFFKCCVPDKIMKNLHLLQHYTGIGLVYILISIIYFAPGLGEQQNYSAYLLLFTGIISIVLDCKFDREKKSILAFPIGTEKVPYVREDLESTSERDNKQRELNSKKLELNPQSENNFNNCTDGCNVVSTDTPIKSNPYDIPDDF